MELAVSTRNHSSTGPTSSLQTALRQFEAALTQEQRQDLLSNNQTSELSDVVVFIAEIDAANQSRRKSVSSRLFTFLDAAHQFANVVDTFVSSNPAIAALVWGTIKASIIIANNVCSYFDKVTAMITEIGRWSPTYAQFGRLYRNDPQIQAMLCQYYAIIIRICTKIVQLHMRPGNAWSRLISSFEADFKPLLNELEREQKHLHVQLHLASQVVIVQSAQMIAEEHNIQKRHRRIFSRFQSYASREQGQISKYLAEQHRSQILDSLSDIRPRETWSIIHAKRVIGTAEWFINESSFEAWYQSDRSSVLWCSGKLGVGKSVLISSMIAHLEQNRNENYYIAYHFCQTGHEATLTAKGIIGSITRQLLARLIDRLGEDEIRAISDMSKDAGLQDITKIFGMCLKPGVGRSYFIIIDGLDECSEEDISIVFKQLKQMSLNSQLCIKLLYSCRPDLERVLTNSLMYNNKLNVTEEILQEDIKIYIDTTLQRCIDEGKLNLTDPKLILKIAEVLDRQNHGMLLWLALFIDELCLQNDDDAIRNILEHPPKGLRALYDEKLSRIRSHDLSESCINVLRYVGVARRPLTVEEMREALSISLNQRELDLTKVPRNMHRILRACRGLIHIDEGSENLLYVHSSLYSHLFPNPGAQLDGFDYAETELRFVSVCLTYFNFKNFTHQVILAPKEGHQFHPVDVALAQTGMSKALNSKLTQKLLHLRRLKASVSPQQLYSLVQQESPNQSFQFKFFDYVSNYWLQHTKDLTPPKNSQFWGVFHSCVANNDLDKWKPWQRIVEIISHDQRTAGDLITWALNHSHSALVLHQLVYDTANIDPLSMTKAIQYTTHLGFAAAEIVAQSCLETRLAKVVASELLGKAVEGNDVDFVNGLIIIGVDIDTDHALRQTLLHWAINYDQFETINRLLTAGAEVNTVDWYRRTPLHSAASQGSVEAMKILLTAGAEVNSVGKPQFTPLHSAATQGRIEVVKILLAAGADINARNRGRETPLFQAAEAGMTEVVKILLAAGADINLADAYQRTPLHAAVTEHHHEVLRILLEAGAHVNASDMNGQTPLFQVAGTLNLKSLQSLIAAGADINTLGDNRETALFRAAKAGMTEVVKILLAAGADTYHSRQCASKNTTTYSCGQRSP